MNLIGLSMNLLLAVLLMAALGMGWRLNRRLKLLREGHDGFAAAVQELNSAAIRAGQALAELRAASDTTTDELLDRIEKGRALAARLERLVDKAPMLRPEALDTLDAGGIERKLGSLLASVREARPERLRREAAPAPAARRPSIEDDLFEEPLTLRAVAGARR